MKVEKTIKGQKFRFYIKFVHHSMSAKVAYDGKEVIAEISSDFKFILLPEDFKTTYITNFGCLPVGKLKLSKLQQMEARDYNPNLKN